jgi:hypothetical protein
VVTLLTAGPFFQSDQQATRAPEDGTAGGAAPNPPPFLAAIGLSTSLTWADTQAAAILAGKKAVRFC